MKATKSPLTEAQKKTIAGRLVVATCPVVLGMFVLFGWLMVNVAGWLALVWPFACAAVVGGMWTWQCRKHGIQWNARDREPADLAARRAGPEEPKPVEDAIPLPKRDRGKTYRYRLLPENGRGAEIAVLVFVNLFWNGIVAVFVVTGLRGEWREMTICLLLFLIPFLLIGVVLVVHLISRILVAMRVRPPVLEIEAEPLAPGMAAKVRLELRGSFVIERLELHLVCEERATYRQGTDTRTESHQVFSETLLEDGPEEVSSYRKYQATASLVIPQSAMHTFKARHNEIAWLLELKVAVRKWPDFEQRYRLRTVPETLRKRLA